MKITKARLKEIIREEMDKLVASGEVSIEEGGARKGDKGKDPRDPDAKDYTDGGDREGDESRGRRRVDFEDNEGTTITGGAKKKTS